MAEWVPPSMATTPVLWDRPAARARALSMEMETSAVPWTTRAGTAISPRRPVMSSRLMRALSGHGQGFGEPGLPAGHPLLHESWLADDEPGHHVSDLVRGAPGHPLVQHGLVEGYDIGVFRPGLGVEQDKAANSIRSPQRHPQRHEAPLGHPADHGPIDAEMVHEADAVIGQVPVRERSAVVDRVTVATAVPGDDPVLAT